MTEPITIVPVTEARQRDLFIKLPWSMGLYKDDPAWVPPLIRDQRMMFDPARGYFFEIGEAQLFLALRGGKPVGRISAHTNSLYEAKYDQETGFFGFLECGNDPAVAGALIRRAEYWLKMKGKTRIQGPQSFSIYDQVGFEVLGADIMPPVGLTHSAAYYAELVEGIGFVKCMDWHCFLVKRSPAYDAYLADVRNRILPEQEVQYRYFSKTELSKRSQDIHSIFNQAWQHNWGHLDLTHKQITMLIDELKLIAIPELTIFAEKNGQTIGFIISLPDINPGLRRLNGHLYPWRIPQLLWHRRRTRRLRTIIMGVLPEYRGQHIDEVFYLLTIENGSKLGYLEADCSLVVETNRLMIRALKPLGAEIYKTYRIYEKPIS